MKMQMKKVNAIRESKQHFLSLVPPDLTDVRNALHVANFTGDRDKDAHMVEEIYRSTSSYSEKYMLSGTDHRPVLIGGLNTVRNRPGSHVPPMCEKDAESMFEEAMKVFEQAESTMVAYDLSVEDQIDYPAFGDVSLQPIMKMRRSHRLARRMWMELERCESKTVDQAIQFDELATQYAHDVDSAWRFACSMGLNNYTPHERKVIDDMKAIIAHITSPDQPEHIKRGAYRRLKLLVDSLNTAVGERSGYAPVTLQALATIESQSLKSITA